MQSEDRGARDLCRAGPYLAFLDVSIGVIYGLLIMHRDRRASSCSSATGPLRAVARRSFVHAPICWCAARSTPRSSSPIQYFELGALHRRAAAGSRRSQNFWIATIYSAVFSVVMNLVLGDRQHYRAARVSQFHHRSVSCPGRGKPLRAVRRHRGIDRAGRAARRGRHPSPARSYLSPAHPCGRRLSRRGAELCRRRGDRDLAGSRRRDRLSSAALLSGDARGAGAARRSVRTRIRRGAADSRQPAFRAGDCRRDRRRQARHRFQRRRHEYRRAAGGAQPQRRWRLSRVPRGDGAVRTRRRRSRFAISGACQFADASMASTWSASDAPARRR